KRAEERIHNENLALREEIDRSSMFEEIVGSSIPLQRVLALVEKVAVTDSTVLITGETGSGKELIARAIHKKSRRAGRAFIRVNRPAIPASLVASELFGHEKGAFTGALQRRLGRFESANGGTIFLEEWGDLPAETQIALLRVLRIARSSGWATATRFPWMCACWLRRTAIWRKRSPLEHSGRIRFTGSTSFRSVCPPSASAPRTFRYSSTT